MSENDDQAAWCDPGGDPGSAAYGGSRRQVPIERPGGVPGGVRRPVDRAAVHVLFAGLGNAARAETSTTTRDRERLDAVAMKTQRMSWPQSRRSRPPGENSGGRSVARQLTAAASVTVYVGSRDAQAGTGHGRRDRGRRGSSSISTSPAPPAPPTPRASSAPGTSWLTTRTSRLRQQAAEIQRASRLPPSA